MRKVITYGTYDLLHKGHIRLLERAKKLGDYLVVGVTSDDFDRRRGKINVKQTLIERIQSVKDTGLADEIIVEEYEGQKIDDIIKYGIDVFTVGSDWEGRFDYLKEYCEVVYLPRTEGISSTDIRTKTDKLRIGLFGSRSGIDKFYKECSMVNGVEVSGTLYSKKTNLIDNKEYLELLKNCDAVYLATNPRYHYDNIKTALKMGKHVLCESPVVLKISQLNELKEIARDNNCVLMEAIKTAYSTAYERLLLLLKMGIIGDIISVDSTCTSLKNIEEEIKNNRWNSMCSWGVIALLPVFQILGTNYKNKNIVSLIYDKKEDFDVFTKIDFTYENAVASIKVGKGVKSESEMIITGTKGYVYVPSPWWKTDYFEVRYENPNDNKRYFYQLDGEGIRNEILHFSHSICEKQLRSNIQDGVSEAICKVVEDFYNSRNEINNY